MAAAKTHRTRGISDLFGAVVFDQRVKDNLHTCGHLLVNAIDLLLVAAFPCDAFVIFDSHTFCQTLLETMGLNPSLSERTCLDMFRV